jgi:hypothetical protein
VAQNQRPLAIQLVEKAIGEDVRYGGDLAWLLAAHPNAGPGESAEAERVALRSADAPSTPRSRVFALCGAAVARARMGDFEESAALARRALDLAQRGSDRWSISIAKLVSSRAEQSRAVILPVPILFGMLWKTHFADFGEPQCHRGHQVRVLSGEVYFDPQSETIRGRFLDCAPRPAS